MKSRLRLAGALLVCVLGVSGCGTTSSAATSQKSDASSDGTDKVEITTAGLVPLETNPQVHLPTSVVDSEGAAIEISDTSRVVALKGGIAEVVVALGAFDQLVGRDVSATFPEAQSVPLVTRAHDISAEAVLSTEPTLVLASNDSGPAEALDQIRSAGVPVVVTDEPTTIEGIAPRIELISAALGIPGAGDKLVTHLQERLSSAMEASAGAAGDKSASTVAFLYMRGNAGVYLLGGDGSGADALIEAAGFLDAGTLENLGPFTPITSEALVAAAPDIILMMDGGLASVGGVEGLTEIPGIAQTPAGRSGAIVTIEDGELYSFGPRTPEVIDRLVVEFEKAIRGDD